MRTMTATEASRAFAALLDEGERGETAVTTRGGRRAASISMAGAGNGAAVPAALRMPIDDENAAADVLSIREWLTDEMSEWPGD